jgi:hypothetical protein
MFLRFLPLRCRRLTDLLRWRLALEPVRKILVGFVLTLGRDQVGVVMFQRFHHQGGFIVRDHGHVRHFTSAGLRL